MSVVQWLGCRLILLIFLVTSKFQARVFCIAGGRGGKSFQVLWEPEEADAHFLKLDRGPFHTSASMGYHDAFAPPTPERCWPLCFVGAPRGPVRRPTRPTGTASQRSWNQSRPCQDSDLEVMRHQVNLFKTRVLP